MEMEQWARVRRKILVEKQSKRSVMSEEGLHWETLQKMLAHSRPPGYRRIKKSERKIDVHVEWVRGVAESSRTVNRPRQTTILKVMDVVMATKKKTAAKKTAPKKVAKNSAKNSGKKTVAKKKAPSRPCVKCKKPVHPRSKKCDKCGAEQPAAKKAAPKKAGVKKVQAKAPKATKTGGDSWTQMVALKKDIDIMEEKLAAKKAAFSKLAASL
jgi:hypothetical protein